MIIRTTVRLDENLYKEARKMAIDKRLAFAQVVNQALKLYLRDEAFVNNLPRLKLKVYKMGPIKGRLNRVDLYENI